MIKRFNDEKPIDEHTYDVFDKDGQYLGHCDYVNDLDKSEYPNGAWYGDDYCHYKPEDTYYSDDSGDWLRMIESLIKIQGE